MLTMPFCRIVCSWGLERVPCWQHAIPSWPVAAAFLLLDDLRAYIEGDNCVIGWALDWLDGKLGELGTSFDELGYDARWALQPIIDVWNLITGAIESAICSRACLR